MKVFPLNGHICVKEVEPEEEKKKLYTGVYVPPEAKTETRYALVEVLAQGDGTLAPKGSKLLILRRMMDKVDVPGLESVVFIPQHAIVARLL